MAGTSGKRNGAKKALSMSEQNAAALQRLQVTVETNGKALNEHAADEAEVWGAVRTQVGEIHAVILGSLDDPDRPGMNERLRKVEASDERRKKFEWLVGGALLTSGLALIVALAKAALVGG